MTEAAEMTPPAVSPVTSPPIPRDTAGRPVPPPMRIVNRAWWRPERALTKAEAEAWHLRQAAELAGQQSPELVQRKLHHLREAYRNSAWQGRQAAPEAV